MYNIWPSFIIKSRPLIILFVNDPDYMHFSYKRYLENKLRERIDFEGTPLKLVCRARD